MRHVGWKLLYGGLLYQASHWGLGDYIDRDYIESGRYSLAAALSDDEGATWKWKRHLDGSPSEPSRNQYHYPPVIQGADGAIHVTYSYYTGAGQTIKHARFDESRIKAGD